MQRRDKGFTMADNDIMEELGGTCAIIYGIIRETYLFWKSKGELVDGYCYVTGPTIQKRTQYGQEQRTTAINQLIDHGLIERKVCGMPRRQWFKITESDQYIEINTQVNRNQSTVKSKSIQRDIEIDTPVYRNHTLSNTREVILDKNTRTTTTKSEVVELYQKSFGLVNPVLYGLMEEDVKEYSEEWVIKALQIAVENNVRSWKYTQAILKRWREQYSSDVKPWEEEKNGKTTRTARTQPTVDWDKETDDII